MYSLMVRERILGSDHWWVLRGLTQRSRIYCLDLKYKRHMDLSKYAVKLQHNPVDTLTSIYVYLLQELCHFLWLVHKDIQRLDSTADFVIGFDDVYDVLEMATTNTSRTRGHNLRLETPLIKNNTRRNFFAHRIIKPWNALPTTIVNSHSTQSFKRQISNLDLSLYLKYPCILHNS